MLYSVFFYSIVSKEYNIDNVGLCDTRSFVYGWLDGFIPLKLSASRNQLSITGTETLVDRLCQLVLTVVDRKSLSASIILAELLLVTSRLHSTSCLLTKMVWTLTILKEVFYKHRLINNNIIFRKQEIVLDSSLLFIWFIFYRFTPTMRLLW